MDKIFWQGIQLADLTHTPSYALVRSGGLSEVCRGFVGPIISAKKTPIVLILQKPNLTFLMPYKAF